MLKLQEFAKQCGVTDRAIQKHLKKHEEELEGHFFRNGPNGTWLDETAQEYIRNLMIQKPISEIVDDRLQKKISELEEDLKRKEQYIMALEAGNIAKQNQINDFEEKQLLLEEKRIEDIKAAEDALGNKLKEQFDCEKAALEKRYQEELEVERTRKLTWRERLTGKKEV